MIDFEGLLIRREGPAGRITLNRPRALNALTLDMIRGVTAALKRWRDDHDVRFVILDGAGERGLCAGGDIRAIYASGLARDWVAQAFFREEYAMNALIAGFPKPFVALMDGVVMGGGVGVSAHANLRIVTERTQLAMPEVAIGLFPDVGGTWLLSRAPGETGVWMALTAEKIGAADAIYAGLADVYVPSNRLGELIESLTGGDEVQPRQVIGKFAQDPGAAKLEERRAQIDSLLRFGDLEDCLTSASQSNLSVAQDFVVALSDKSPTSLKVTFQALRDARKFSSLEDCLQVEYRIASRMLDGPDFFEGVRAALIDKDRSPRWRPATLAEVTPDILARYFQPRTGDDLQLPVITAR